MHASSNGTTSKVEFMHEGKLVSIEAVSERSPKAYDFWVDKDSKPVFEYVGSGYKYILNGKNTTSSVLLYFFKRVVYQRAVTYKV